MKNLLIVIILMFFMVGCVSSDQSLIKIDGTVDAVETALIRVAVGSALTVKPELAAPCYAVSTTMLNKIEGGALPLGSLEEFTNAEINKLELTPLEKESMKELVALVKVLILQEIKIAEKIPELPAMQKLVVVTQILEIVKESAGARL